ncbi:hypothetical protein UlMin_042760 [Ulmus minor]
MNGGDEWRMISCTGRVEDRNVLNRIMLRFRPIAPKPETTADGSGGFSFENKNSIPSNGRKKRKYVRVRRNSGYTRKKTISEEKIGKDHEGGVTLQLLPEKSEDLNQKYREELDLGVSRNDSGLEENRELSMSFSFDKNVIGDDKVTDRTHRSFVQMWVTVECVTGMSMESIALGSTDDERVRNLEGDTCPGFISDGLNRVSLVNGAFKRMVSQQNDGQLTEIMVGLVMKEKLSSFNSTFTGHVKLQYLMGNNSHQSQMVPCDLWRLDGGGFAWRLDVEAALTLGR